MKVRVEPSDIVAAPGDRIAFVVQIGNDGDATLYPSLTITGIAPRLLELPDQLAAIEPGATSTVELWLNLPAEVMPGEQRVGVRVQDPDGWQRAAVASAKIEIGARPDVALDITPSSSRGRRGAEVTTVLHNRSAEPVPITLWGEGEGVRLAFASQHISLKPGEERTVATWIERRKRHWFRERRHGALIEARGHGAPVLASTSFVQRPLISPWMWKLVAAVTAVAVWAAAVVVAFNWMGGDDLHPSKLAAPGPGVVQALAAAAAAAAGEGDETEDVLLVGDEGGPQVVISGSVVGPADPMGTDIVIERIAFGDAGTTASNATRLAAMTPTPSRLGSVLDRVETSTDERGNFRISGGLSAPAFYRVTALRPGFEVASHVVQTDIETLEATAELELVPATGSLSGRVTGSGGGGLGGVTVTVSDGALTYTTTTATDDGTWSLAGVATPATFQVIFTEISHASATVVVDLDGGEDRSGVDAQLDAGRGTIRGQVASRGAGVGAITVHVEGNPTDQTTTTLTEGALAGSFTFPSLSFGTYRLTFSGEGWQTQTSQVTVDRGDVEVAIPDLRRATGVIEGRVEQQVARGGGCNYPEVDHYDQAIMRPCGGVGVSVVGTERTYRTTSSSQGGGFQVSGVEPGEYLVRFDRFGYVPQFYDVTVVADDVITLPSAGAVELSLQRPADMTAGEIRGVLRDSIDPTAPFTPPEGTEVRVVGQPDAEVAWLADGTFSVTGVALGAQRLEVKAPGYDLRSQIVQVPLRAPADVGIVPVVPLGTLAMWVLGPDSTEIEGAEVFVAPDPVLYDDRERAHPVIEAAGPVEFCTRTVTLDDAERTLDGVCALAQDRGAVEFRRSFATGSYVFFTPTNQEDLADDPAFQAQTVPLDHEQMSRRFEISSGATLPLEPTLRRYPIITGSVRTPSLVDEGLVPENIQPDDIVFELINEQGEAQPLPDDLPDLRISASGDPALNMPPGRYRIDRIPPELASGMLWRLRVESPNGVFERGPFPDPPGPVEGLRFNVTETINALLLPRPHATEFAFRFGYAADGGTATHPVVGARLQIVGIGGFDVLDEPPFYRPRFVTCPGDGCFLPPDLGNPAREDVDFRPGVADPRVQEIDGAWWLLTGVGAHAPGEVRIPPFYRPGPAQLRVVADGFEPLVFGPDDAFELEASETGEVMPVDLEMTPIPRDVVGTVQLDPPDATYHSFLAALGLADDTDIFASTTVTLDGFGGPWSLTPASDGSFVFPDIPPGDYELTLANDHDWFTPQTTSFFVPAASGPFDLDAQEPDTVLVQRLGVARIALTGYRDDQTFGPMAGVEVVLEQAVDGTLDWQSYATLTTCIDGADTMCGPAPAEGAVTFAGLPVRAADGAPLVYRVQVAHPGYVDATFTMPPLVDAPYQHDTHPLSRYGELTGSVVGQIGSQTPYTLEGVEVSLVDYVTHQEIPGVPSVTTDATGRFIFPHTFEIEPRPCSAPACVPGITPGSRYALRFEAEEHFPLTETDQLIFPYDSFRDAPETVLEALPVHLIGAISGPDPWTMVCAAACADHHVRVEVAAYLDGSATPAAVVETGPAGTFVDPETGVSHPLADGAYVLEGLDAGEYRLTFTVIAVGAPGTGEDANAAPDWFLTHELTGIALTPGVVEHHDVHLPYTLGSLRGAIDGIPYAGGAAVMLEGVEVTATRVGDPDTVRHTTTDEQGTYLFEDLPRGTYDVTFAAAGYQSAAPFPTVVDPAANVVLDRTLIAAPNQITATVSSAFQAGTPASPMSLPDVLVTATHPDPLVDDVVVATGPDGHAALTLVPGTWTLTTAGTSTLAFVVDDRPFPHHPFLPTDVEVEIGDAPAAVALSMTPYVEVSGVLDLPDADQAEGADIIVQGAPDSLIEHDAAVDEDGVFRFWLVQPPDDATTVQLRFDLTVYELDVVIDPDSIANYKLDLGALTMGYKPVDMQVPVTSAFDDAPLVGVEVIATNMDASPPTTTSAVTDADGVASLSLLPGNWTLSTVGTENDSFAVNGAWFPHVNQPARPLEVRPGEHTSVPLVLDPYIRVYGQLERSVGGSADGASVVVTGDATAMVATTTTDALGAFQAWLRTAPTDATSVAFVFGLADYDDLTVAINPNAIDDFVLDLATTTMDASAVSIGVEVSSALGDQNLAGVEVTASPVPLNPHSAASALTDAQGIATLSLRPGEWQLSTSGTQALNFEVTGAPFPHVDHASSPLVVDVGQADEVGLTLTPYVRVHGHLHLPDAEVANGATVALEGDDDALVETSTTQSTGAFQVWLPAVPAAAGDVELVFEREHYDTLRVPVDPAAVTDFAVDLLTPVLVPSEVQIEVTVTSALATTPTVALPGVEVTVSAAGTTVSAVSDGDGVAVFDLRPDTWSLSTSGTQTLGFDVGATSLPHVDTSRSLQVNVGQPRGVVLELDPYVRVYGVVALPGGSPAPGAAVGVVGDPGALIETATTSAGGNFQVWLPAPPAAAGDVELAFELAHHDQARVAVDPDDVAGFATNLGTTPLVASAMEVEVTVLSSSGVPLGDVGVYAAHASHDDVSKQTDSHGTAMLLLRPGTWELTTTGTDTVAFEVEGSPFPHRNHPVQDVVVEVGEPGQIGVVLDAYLRVHGTLQASGSSDPAGAAVTVQGTDGSLVDAALVETTIIGTSGTFHVWLPRPPAAAGDVVVEFSSPDHDTLEIALDPDDIEDDVLDLGTLTLTPWPLIAVTVRSSGGAVLPDVVVVAAKDGSSDHATEATTGASGIAFLKLEPGSWELATKDTDDLAFTVDASVFPHVGSGVQPLTVASGEDDAVDLVLQPYVRIFGTVLLSDATAAHGATVVIGGDDEELAAGALMASTSTDEAGTVELWLPQAPDATDEIVVVLTFAGYDELAVSIDPADIVDGELDLGTLTLIEEDESEEGEDDGEEGEEATTDGMRSAAHDVAEQLEGVRLRTDLVTDATASTTFELSGVVLDDAGTPVAGAKVTATSSLGTTSDMSASDGVYKVAGLDDSVTWKVTFAPPDGFVSSPVSRWVAPGGTITAALALDQVLPSAFGDLVVHVADGPLGGNIEVTLSETTPFPTIGEDGEQRRTITLDAAGAGTVTFAGLVPGDGRSVPQNRFAIRVEGAGIDPVTRSGVDVAPGGTTRITFGLVPTAAAPRTVELLLADRDGPLINRQVHLVRDTTTLTATAAPGSHHYRVVDVLPGTWEVMVGGYRTASVTVAAGDAVQRIHVFLTIDPDVGADTSRHSDTTGPGSEHIPEAPDVEDGQPPRGGVNEGYGDAPIPPPSDPGISPRQGGDKPGGGPTPGDSHRPSDRSEPDDPGSDRSDPPEGDRPGDDDQDGQNSADTGGFEAGVDGAEPRGS